MRRAACRIAPFGKRPLLIDCKSRIIIVKFSFPLRSRWPEGYCIAFGCRQREVGQPLWLRIIPLSPCTGVYIKIFSLLMIEHIISVRYNRWHTETHLWSHEAVSWVSIIHSTLDAGCDAPSTPTYNELLWHPKPLHKRRWSGLPPTCWHDGEKRQCL